MYVPPAFQSDRAASLAFAAARGFGLVVACGNGRPHASLLPFRLAFAPDGTPRAAFHVARNNPLAAAAAQGGHWLVAVTGADAYVSPDWYASQDQVPTWLYRAVHLSGSVRVMDRAELQQHVDELTDTFEAWLAPKPPWTADKVTSGRRTQLMKAIVGIEMEVETVEGSFKLNQHKSDADHVAVAGALAARSDAGSQAIAAELVALRPHLTYQQPAPAYGK
ncbi:MAG TPA: FMN-binding negative transcriptional regulator [Xanthobacteraceae bacterium]